MKIIRSIDIEGDKRRRNEPATFCAVHAHPGQIFENHSANGKIVILLHGNTSLSMQSGVEHLMEGREMTLVPPKTLYTVKVIRESHFCIFTLNITQHFTNGTVHLPKVAEARPDPAHSGIKLPVHPRLGQFMEVLHGHMEDGLSSDHFYTHKAKEFLFIMRSYYTQDELAMFFRPLIENDIQFSEFVLKNYHRYKTVQELAQASCHSLSAFNKVFKKTFGQSPYHWMNEQKASSISYELKTTNLSLKELCRKYGFGSLPQFTNFCKKHLGKCPTSIRGEAGATHGEEQRVK